jgi:hypothetical protein
LYGPRGAFFFLGGSAGTGRSAFLLRRRVQRAFCHQIVFICRYFAQFEQSFTHHCDENRTSMLTFILQNNMIAIEKTITRQPDGNRNRPNRPENILTMEEIT